MEKEEVIKNLKDYNAWRAGAPIEMLKVEVISDTIDEAIRLLEEENKMTEEQMQAFEAVAKHL